MLVANLDVDTNLRAEFAGRPPRCDLVGVSDGHGFGLLYEITLPNRASRRASVLLRRQPRGLSAVFPHAQDAYGESLGDPGWDDALRAAGAKFATALWVVSKADVFLRGDR